MRQRSIYIIILLYIFSSFQLKAQTVDIKQPFNDTLLCVGSSFVLDYIVLPDSFKHNNIFRVELSNATGSFANPTVIGFSPGFESWHVTCTIPSNTSPGTGYRIRVTASSPNYVSANNGKNIRISDTPSVSLSTNTPICGGDDLHLSATTSNPSPTYKWTGPGGYSSNQQNPVITSVPYTSAGYYYLRLTSYGCSVTDSVKANIYPPPAAPFNFVVPGPSVCEDDDYFISPDCNICDSSGVIYEYTIPTLPPFKKSGSFTYKNIPASLQGWYKVKIILGTCSAVDSYYVTIHPLADTPEIQTNSPLCVGDTLLLSGTCDTPGVTYRWEGPGGFTSNQANTSIPNITFGQAGTYKLYAIKNGCDSKPREAEVEIGIPLLPLQITGDTMLCPGDKLQLSGKGSTSQGTYEWKGPNNFFSPTRTFGINPVAAKHAGRYEVTQTLNGCTSPPSYINVTIPDIQYPAPENNGSLCIGDKLKLTITETNGGSYNWTGPDNFTSGDPNPEVDNVQPIHGGLYIVTTSLDYCTITDSTEVVIKPKPHISTVSSNSPVCDQDQLMLAAECDLPDAEFSWSGPNGFASDKHYPSIVFTENISGTYIVKATVDSCVSEAASTEVIAREGPGNSKAKSNSPLKEGDNLELEATNSKPDVKFVWTGPDSFYSEEQNPVIKTVSYLNDGLYTLTSIYNECSTQVNVIVKIKDLLGLKFQLYPNPNNGKFTVEGIAQNDAIIKASIYNYFGRQLYLGEIQPVKNKFKSEIDITGAPSGVYMLQLISGGEKHIINFTIISK